MRLLVTLLYYCPRDSADRAYLTQVVRIELLGRRPTRRRYSTLVAGRKRTVRFARVRLGPRGSL